MDGNKSGRPAVIAKYRHPVKPGTVTVAGKPGKDVPAGTLNNIMKQAGLK